MSTAAKRERACRPSGGGTIRDTPITVFLENASANFSRSCDGLKAVPCGSWHSRSAIPECAFVRLLLSHPEEGREILERAGLAIIESDLIGVELPDGPQPLLQICTALLQAEVNIIQAYPIIVRPHGRAAVALMVDNIDLGLETLASKQFTTITEGDLAADVL